MKRLWLLIILVIVTAFPLLPTHAQNKKRIVSGSERYSLPLPEGWYGTSEAAVEDMQGFLPYESVTVATSQADLEAFLTSDFSLSDLSTLEHFNGAVVGGTIFPKALSEMAGITPDSFLSLIDTDADVPIERISIQNKGLMGEGIRAKSATHSAILLPVLDDAGNFILLFGFTKNDYLREVQAILADVDYNLFEIDTLYNAAALDTTIEILPDVVNVDIPPGWWVLTDDISLASPEFSVDFMDAFSTGEFADTEGFTLMAIELDKSSFPPEVYDENTPFDPENLIAVLKLADILEVEDTELILSNEIWASEFGLEGVIIEMDEGALGEGVQTLLVFVNINEKLIILAGIGNTAGWSDYKPLSEAIFETARSVDSNPD